MDIYGTLDSGGSATALLCLDSRQYLVTCLSSNWDLGVLYLYKHK